MPSTIIYQTFCTLFMPPFSNGPFCYQVILLSDTYSPFEYQICPVTECLLYWQKNHFIERKTFLDRSKNL